VGEEPLTGAEAQKILSEDPPQMETSEDAIRYVEAWMVKAAGRIGSLPKSPVISRNPW
jgi:hypothetical protein